MKDITKFFLACIMCAVAVYLIFVVVGFLSR